MSTDAQHQASSVMTNMQPDMGSGVSSGKHHQCAGDGGQGHLDKAQQCGRGAGDMRKGPQRNSHGIGQYQPHGQWSTAPWAPSGRSRWSATGGAQPHEARGACSHDGTERITVLGIPASGQPGTERAAAHVADDRSQENETEVLHRYAQHVDVDKAGAGQVGHQACVDQAAGHGDVR